MNPRLLVSALAVIIITACKSSNNNSEIVPCINSEIVPCINIDAPQASYLANEPQKQPANFEQKIIKHADIEIEVADMKLAKETIDSTLLLYKSVVISDRFINSEGYTSNGMEIKVPSENFSILLEQLSKIAKRVTRQVINSEDVIEEYIDIQASIKNKKKVERSLLSLLNKASNVEDILKIQIELGNVRAEIESIQGRMNYIDNRVNFSNISLTINPESLPAPKSTFGQKIVEALKNGYKGLTWFAMFIISTWPIWIILIIVLLVIRWRRNKIAEKILTEKMEKQAKKFERKHKKDKKKDVFKDAALQETDLQQ